MSDMCVCKECGNEFPRRSPKGPKPQLCDEHRDPRLTSLGGKKGPGSPLRPEEQAAEAAREAARVYQPEPSWLDEPEVQAQLVERNEAAVGVIGPAAPDADASEPEFPECSAPNCGSQPLYPTGGGGKFCLSHWHQISLDVRGVLLGAEVGSAPWNAAVVKAIRSLR